MALDRDVCNSLTPYDQAPTLCMPSSHQRCRATDDWNLQMVEGNVYN